MTVNRRELAERGARIRLAEIEAEQAELLEAFPDMLPAPEPAPIDQRKVWTMERRKAHSKRLKAIHRKKKRLAEEQE